MKAEMELPPSSFLLHALSRLWLHEPDDELADCAVRELGLPAGSVAELRSAYADVFLLNVYPYGSAFTDPDGELNGPGARRAAALYEARGYQPPELFAVAAPDHLGLCLGFLAHTGERSLALEDEALDWAPVCCLAVEREPSAHPFYRALAAQTRQTLLSHHVIRDAQYAARSGHRPREAAIGHPLSAAAEVGLRDLVRFFLAPARCGVFFSRSRLGWMATGLGTRLPFGARLEVAERLFAWAGEAGRIEPLLAMLSAEATQWAAAYQAWDEQYPAWRPFAAPWLSRTADAQRLIADMRQAAVTAKV